jgi:hypothetical protein
MSSDAHRSGPYSVGPHSTHWCATSSLISPRSPKPRMARLSSFVSCQELARAAGPAAAPGPAMNSMTGGISGRSFEAELLFQRGDFGIVFIPGPVRISRASGSDSVRAVVRDSRRRVSTCVASRVASPTASASRSSPKNSARSSSSNTANHANWPSSAGRRTPGASRRPGRWPGTPLSSLPRRRGRRGILAE